MSEYQGLDRVLFNPKRFMIAVFLYLHGPTTMADLQRALGLSWGDLDSNIRRLREAGYVEVRKVPAADRPRTVVRLTAEGVRRLEELMVRLESLLREVKGRS